MTADPDAPPPERYWALRPRKITSRGYLQRQRETLTSDPQARDFLVKKWVTDGRMVDVAEFEVRPVGRSAVKHVQVSIKSHYPKKEE